MSRRASQTERPARRWLRLGGVVVVLAAVGAAAVLGWRWHRSIPVRRIVVEGAAHAAPEALAALARVDTGDVLYALQPHLVADRVERHPWVARAEAVRSADGTLRLSVTERTPTALVLQERDDAAGEGAYYLDAAGYPIPAGDAAFDVPLVRGFGEAFQPLRPVSHAPLRRLLTALNENARAEALVSEIRVDEEGSLALRTVPADGRGRSTEVRLGTGAFPEKLHRFTAFWQQAVREQPQTAFRRVDLRFDDQIVAQP